MTGWLGLISSVLRPDIMETGSLFWNDCAFMTRSCCAEYPNCDVTTTTGESVKRFDSSTFSILTPASFMAPFSVRSVSFSFHQSVRGLYMSISFLDRDEFLPLIVSELLNAWFIKKVRKHEDLN